MHYREIKDTTITSMDAHRLRRWLCDEPIDSLDQEHLRSLEEGLNMAHVVEPGSIPGNIVTLDSRVRIQDLNSGKESTYTLVMPHEANIALGAIAITAPLGRAMFGRKTGDILRFKTPGGWRLVKILEILYQPEAAGARRREIARIREDALRSGPAM